MDVGTSNLEGEEEKEKEKNQFSWKKNQEKPRFLNLGALVDRPNAYPCPCVQTNADMTSTK